MKINIQCVTLGPTRSISVVAIAWFNRIHYTYRPSLAICYENGKFQIMRNENDDSEYAVRLTKPFECQLICIICIPVPIIVESDLQAADCQWNHDGSILAVCGIKMYGSDKDTNQVIFYSPLGVVCISINVNFIPSKSKYCLFNFQFPFEAIAFVENPWPRSDCPSMGRKLVTYCIGSGFVHLLCQYSTRLHVVLFWQDCLLSEHRLIERWGVLCYILGYCVKSMQSEDNR